MHDLELSIFELSPIPMWIQDYSGVKKIFESWVAQGITDIRAYLLEQPNRLLPCLPTIRTTRINKSTLRLYEANNLEEILESFAKMHYETVLPEQINFFMGLWERNPECTFTAINYTCTGRQIDVQLRANILPDHLDSWDQVLLTTEDVSQSQNARRFAEALFFHSPTALCVKDYSEIKLIFDQLKTENIYDLESYIALHPHFLNECFNKIKYVKVNQALLNLFKARDEQHFNQQIRQIFKESHRLNLYTQLMHLWNGHYHLQRECEYQTIDGDTLHVLEQFVIFPDSHHNWDTVQISFTDFTERKLLENHLHYVNKHDHLTKLNNRTFFNEEIQRLQSQNIHPVSCIYLDINGLKKVNDTRGHHYGDLLLTQFAKILKNATAQTTYSVSRIGGDEFVILMPFATEKKANRLLSKIQNLILQANQLDSTLIISAAAGVSSTEQCDDIESLIKITDNIMYAQKQLYYLTPPS